MPHSVSARKRVRQNETHHVRNRAVKSSVRTSVKRFRAHVAAGDLDKARAEYAAVVKKLDQAAAKRVLHKNTASRYKSRLAALLNRASA